MEQGVPLDEQQEIYCKTLDAIRDILKDGDLANVPGILWTENLKTDGNASPFTCPNEVSYFGEGPSGLTDTDRNSLTSDGDGSSSLLFSAAAILGVAMGMSVALAMWVAQRRPAPAPASAPVVRNTSPRSRGQSACTFPPRQIEPTESRVCLFSSLSSLNDDEGDHMRRFEADSIL